MENVPDLLSAQAALTAVGMFLLFYGGAAGRNRGRVLLGGALLIIAALGGLVGLFFREKAMAFSFRDTWLMPDGSDWRPWVYFVLYAGIAVLAGWLTFRGFAVLRVLSDSLERLWVATRPLYMRLVPPPWLPYRMSCAEWSNNNLYPLSDGRFQLMYKEGVVVPVMVGYRYVLVEKPLAAYLRSLNLPGISFRPTIIWDRKNDVEYHSHEQLFVEERITCSEIGKQDLSGKRMFNLEDDALYVTPELKEVLENSSFKYLEFSMGLRALFTMRLA